jgi:hypothetical protein
VNLSRRSRVIVRVAASIGLLIMFLLAFNPALGWFKP